MGRFWKHGIAVLALAAAVGLWCFSPAVAKKPSGGGGGGGGGTTTHYKIVELAHRPGDAYGINAAGDCVGEITELDGLRKPYLWLVDASGGVTPLPLSLLTPPGEPILPAGSAQDTSDDGLIVGYLLEPNVQTFAAYWPNALADPILLPVPVDSINSAAYAVNNNGVIVGYYVDVLDVLHPVAWGLRGDGTVAGPVDMQAVPGCRGVPKDVNDSQTVVGSQAVAGGSGGEAWLWQLAWDGTTLSLGGGYPLTPLFPAGSYVYSYAYGINNVSARPGHRPQAGAA